MNQITVQYETYIRGLITQALFSLQFFKHSVIKTLVASSILMGESVEIKSFPFSYW